MSNMRRGDQAVRLAAAIGDAVRRGKSERQRKVERFLLELSGKDEQAAEILSDKRI